MGRGEIYPLSSCIALFSPHKFIKITNFLGSNLEKNNLVLNVNFFLFTRTNHSDAFRCINKNVEHGIKSDSLSLIP